MCHKIDTLYTKPFVFSQYPSNSAIIEHKRKCTSIVVLVLEFVDVQSCRNSMCIIWHVSNSQRNSVSAHSKTNCWCQRIFCLSLFVQDCQSHNSLVKSPSCGSFVSIGSSSASSSLSSAISQELQRRSKVKNMKLFINKVLPT